MSDAIYFNSKTPEWAWLSNFAESPIVDNKNAIWPTAEHAYQGQKTLDPEWKRTIRGSTTPALAKRWGSQAPLRPHWNLKKVGFMQKILRAKFDQNQELRIQLLQTEDRELIHEAPWDDFWGSGAGNRGLNKLGVLLMELRSTYRRETEEDADRAGDGDATEVTQTGVD